MKKFKEFLDEVTKVALYTHPETLGADVHSTNTGLPNPVKNIPMHKLHPTEPESKMKQPGSSQVHKKLIGAIKTGSDIPPITVIPHPTINGHYQVVDGHHRLYAGKSAGARTMKSEIVPSKNVSTNPNKWEG